MKTIKIILAVAIIAAISSFVPASAQELSHASSTPAQKNQLLVGYIKHEIDSLSSMPDFKFERFNDAPEYKFYEGNYTLMPYFYECSQLHKAIVNHIYNAYESRRLGNNESENLQVEEILSRQLYAVYTQKFTTQISFILRWRPAYVYDYNLLVPTHRLRNSQFIEKNSPADSSLYEIQQRMILIYNQKNEQNQKPAEQNGNK
jgi:hypothetical protein